MAAISKTSGIHRPHIPHGHVLVNEKWHGSDIVRSIQGLYLDLEDFAPEFEFIAEETQSKEVKWKGE